MLYQTWFKATHLLHPVHQGKVFTVTSTEICSWNTPEKNKNNDFDYSARCNPTFHCTIRQQSQWRGAILFQALISRLPFVDVMSNAILSGTVSLDMDAGRNLGRNGFHTTQRQGVHEVDRMATITTMNCRVDIIEGLVRSLVCNINSCLRTQIRIFESLSV